MPTSVPRTLARTHTQPRVAAWTPSVARRAAARAELLGDACDAIRVVRDRYKMMIANGREAASVTLRHEMRLSTHESERARRRYR